jgi:diguanylate cyclase (GGDEF)-like protein
MYRAILFTLGTDDYLYNLGTVTYWASLVFLILFFTFRGNKALIISLIIYSLILAPGLYHFLFSPYRTEDTLDTLIQFYISSIGTIVMLYYFQKIIEIYLQAESAHQSANTDYLTKLPNRRNMDLLLNEQIAASRANSLPLTISLFDVDYFKKVNDTYGHDVGDSVLVELSDLLTAYIGQKFYVGRWGGEEFLLVCPGKNLKEIHEYGENIRKVIEEHPFRFVGKLTCSFGVAELLSGDLAKELLKRADEALYQAKESGKNRIIAKATKTPAEPEF